MNRIFLTRATLPDFDEYVEEIRNIWETHWVTTMGPRHNKLEEMLEGYFQSGKTTLFVNGHNALEAAISSLKKKGEIITTPFSFISTTHAIVRTGNIPVFCDISEKDFNIDVDQLEKHITNKTIAILPVHTFGIPCDVEAIQRVTEKYGISVIYDAAHAFGVRYKGKSIANFGDMSVFSFHASKVFNCGEGGCIVSNNSNADGYLKMYRMFGINNDKSEIVGTNAKMNELSAALGICNLRHISETISRRKEIYDYYMDRLVDVKGVKIEKADVDIDQNYSYFPLRIDSQIMPNKRDAICSNLNDLGIQVLRHFYPIIPDHPCYHVSSAKNNDLPVARKISEEILLLPLYDFLSINEADYVIESLKNALDNRGKI